MSYRDDYKEGQSQFLWTLPRAVLAVLALIVAVFLLLVAATPLTIGFGWFSGEANLRSFPHVAETYALAFDDAKALDANAQQACDLEKAIAAETDPAAKSQRQSQLLAVAFNYDRVRGEYDAYLSDHFRGHLLHPNQLPVPYPTLDERKKQVCGR